MRQSQQPEFEPPLIRRAHMAVFISGIFASIAVALVGIIAMSVWAGLTGNGASPPYQSELDANYVFWSAASVILFISAFNWYGFIVVIPAAWLILGLLSVVFKAESKPSPASKFYKVGAFTTSLIVFFASFLGTGDILLTGDLPITISALSGSIIASCLIGVPAGLLITFVYRAILRPPAYSAP